MFKGFIFFILFLVLTILTFLLYNGYQFGKSAKWDLPKIKLISKSFIDIYNENDAEKLYSFYSKTTKAAFTKEVNAEKFNQIIIYTGHVELGEQLNWHVKSQSSTNYFNINYKCSSELGNYTLKLNYILEDKEWKLLGFNFQKIKD